jgi:hypothetical protein
MYAIDHHGVYPRRLADLLPNYLKCIPTCPGAGTDTYSDSYFCSRSRQTYAFCCLGLNHPGLVDVNEPAYDSEEGLRVRHLGQADPYNGYLRFSQWNMREFGQSLLACLCLAGVPVWMWWIGRGAVPRPFLAAFEGLVLAGAWLGWMAPALCSLVPLGLFTQELEIRLVALLSIPMTGLWTAWRSRGRGCLALLALAPLPLWLWLPSVGWGPPLSAWEAVLLLAFAILATWGPERIVLRRVNSRQGHRGLADWPEN